MRLCSNKFALFNMLITSMFSLIAIFMIIGMCAHYAPSELFTSTGTVARFDQHEADRFSESFLNDHSFFNVTFTDGSFFEIIGGYDKIDSALFSRLSTGDTLTVTYQKRGYGANSIIYGIEYDGATYLDKNDLPPPKDQNTAFWTYTIILICSAAVAVTLFVINCCVNKRRRVCSDDKKCP